MLEGDRVNCCDYKKGIGKELSVTGVSIETFMRVEL